MPFISRPSRTRRLVKRTSIALLLLSLSGAAFERAKAHEDRESISLRSVARSMSVGRGVVNDSQARIEQNVRLPQGYRVEYGGQFESEAQASRQLLWLSIAVVIAIFFILCRDCSIPLDVRRIR
jgi:Cu/Ag efflux pump CusA